MKMVFKYLILTIIFVFYVVYTLRFSIVFRRNILFSGVIRTFHLIMFWLIPFVWIFILKSVMKSTPGSAHFPNKENPESSTESGLGIWIDPGTGN